MRSSTSSAIVKGERATSAFRNGSVAKYPASGLVLDKQAQANESMDQSNDIFGQNNQGQVKKVSDQGQTNKFIGQNQVIEAIFQDEISDQDDDDDQMYWTATNHLCQRHQDQVVDAIPQDDVSDEDDDSQMSWTSSNHCCQSTTTEMGEHYSQQKVVQEKNKAIQAQEIRVQGTQTLVQQQKLSQEREKIIEEIRVQEMRVQKNLAQIKLAQHRLAQLQQNSAQQSLIVAEQKSAYGQNLAQERDKEVQENNGRGQEELSEAELFEENSAGEGITEAEELTKDTSFQHYPSTSAPHTLATPVQPASTSPTIHKHINRSPVRLVRVLVVYTATAYLSVLK